MTDHAFQFMTELAEERSSEAPVELEEIKPIVISNLSFLTLQQVILIARRFCRVQLDSLCAKALDKCRALLEEKIAAGETIYGVNTGFGGNARYLIPPEDLPLHQANLLSFLSAGTGSPMPLTMVRAAMLIRANALARGWSGVRSVVVERLLDLLNKTITPVVPRWGSVGASGDLVPSAHIASCLLGKGEVVYNGKVVPASEALRAEGISPLELEAKEGLALVNGTTMMTGVAAFVVEDTQYLLRLVLVTIALAAEALKSSPDYYDARIQAIKNHPGQIAVARFLREVLEGSRQAVALETIRQRLAATTSLTRESHSVEVASESVQSPYSLRCVPQGLGPVCETLQQARTTIEREINSANDNPLIDPFSGDVLHSGNFYGGHIANTMDGLKIGLCNAANWLHSIMGMLMDSRFSNGLPDSLSPRVGLYQGFKGVQLSHSSLVTAIRHLSAPSSIHTLPTEQFNQDMVSLGTHSALTAADITTMLRDVVAMTLLAVAQAVNLRGSVEELGNGTRPVFEAVRTVSPFLNEDRALDSDIRKVAVLIENHEIPVPELF